MKSEQEIRELLGKAEEEWASRMRQLQGTDPALVDLKAQIERLKWVLGGESISEAIQTPADEGISEGEESSLPYEVPEPFDPVSEENVPKALKGNAVPEAAG